MYRSYAMSVHLFGNSVETAVMNLWPQAWSGGGYSDDLIMAAKCGEHHLQIICPPFTIFPQRYADVATQHPSLSPGCKSFMWPLKSPAWSRKMQNRPQNLDSLGKAPLFPKISSQNGTYHIFTESSFFKMAALGSSGPALLVG